MGIPELLVLIAVVGIPVIIISLIKRRKHASKTKASVDNRKTPAGIVLLAWLIIAETIIEFGMGIFEGLPLMQSSNISARIKVVALLYAVGVSVLKLLISIGLLRGKNVARWSWVAFGLALFALSTLQENIGIPVGLNIFAEVLKWFWIGTLFFLFKPDMNAYFTAGAHKQNAQPQMDK